MDSKNVIAAISLSAAVIILYSLFFAPSPQELKKIQEEKSQVIESTEAPSLEVEEKVLEISRSEAKSNNQRVEFENISIKGSISLMGSTIDDLTFKDYNNELESNEKIILLAPRNIEDGYLIESGFVTSDKNVDIPDAETIWSLKGNNKLTDKSPIKLSWTNKQGLTFEKEISLDDKFLFTIRQKVINSTNNKYDFYSYGQIIRNKIPEDLLNFFILHEGPIATLDDELIEEDYDDIQEQKFSKTSQKWWLGISYKFWITPLLLPRVKEFKTTFDYMKQFRTNCLTT